MKAPFFVSDREKALERIVSFISSQTLRCQLGFHAYEEVGERTEENGDDRDFYIQYRCIGCGLK